VFVTASATLDDEWKRYVKSFEEYISEPTADESEVEIACQEKDGEEERHRQRIQGVGALALDWFVFSLKGVVPTENSVPINQHPCGTLIADLVDALSLLASTSESKGWQSLPRPDVECI
jgi:hypothetical protein